jgi:hypothetical protein
LSPLHPDRAGGIGFLAGSSYAFAPIVFAQSAVLAGIILGRILYGGQSYDLCADRAFCADDSWAFEKVTYWVASAMKDQRPYKDQTEGHVSDYVVLSAKLHVAGSPIKVSAT